MAGRRAKWFYRTARWQALRSAVLDAANWRCDVCGGYANEVHHRRPIALGGDPWAVENLRAVCRMCHREAHCSRERRAWRRLARAELRGSSR